MRIYALLSFYDEQPEHLTRCVASLRGFADVLVALDGAYATFPGARAESPLEQTHALNDAVREVGVSWKITSPWQPWASEVEKRATLFELARNAGATADDWFLIVDADMCVGEFTPEAREKLAATDCDVAEVCWHDVQIDGKRVSTHRFRSLFRALPGLTVERAHYLYTTPEPCTRCGYGIADHAMGDAYYGNAQRCKVGRRFLWHLPDGHLSDEPICDLYEDVTLEHYNSSREPDRRQRALDYYKDRDARGLEAVGRDWTGFGGLT